MKRMIDKILQKSEMVTVGHLRYLEWNDPTIHDVFFFWIR